jgi:hypothetical protein
MRAAESRMDLRDTRVLLQSLNPEMLYEITGVNETIARNARHNKMPVKTQIVIK